MPYSDADDPDLPDNVKALPEAKRRQWVVVWNSVYRRCIDDGGTADACETTAFPQAWGSIKEERDMAELETMTVPDVAILRTGKGFQGQGCPKGGCEFTEANLDDITAAYWATKGTLEPPVKLGHDDQQKLLQEDGYPAAGWVANVRRLGDRLYADLVNVPKRVAELVKAGAYRYLSVELDKNMEIGKTKYPLVLTGLALLGADLPAVDSLGGIAGLYQSLHLELKGDTKAFVFDVEGQEESDEETLDAIFEQFDNLVAKAERHYRGRVGAPVLRNLSRAFKEGLRRAARKMSIRLTEWDTAWINDLPDSAFAYIASGGEKDERSKTAPRSLRYLPHHDDSGAVDLSHLRNALARVPQTNLPVAAKAQVLRHLESHARREGVGEK